MLTLAPPGRLVDVGGYRVHLHAIGHGRPPVVFVSGIAASCLNWVGLQRAIAPHARAVTSDRAGLGWSDLGPRGLTASDHAAHLVLALRAAGIDLPCVFVGHSYGGYVVQLIARQHPEAVAGAVLIDPISWHEWVAPGPSQRRMLLGGALFARVGAALAALGVVGFAVRRFRGGSEGVGRALLGSFGKGAVAAVSRVLGEVGKMPRDTWEAIQFHWSRPRAFVAMARHFEALVRSAVQVRDAEATGARWPFPLVVLGAGRSGDEVKIAQRQIARLSRRGRYEVVDGAGHWVHLDAQDAVERAILDVLGEVRGGDGVR